MIGQPNVSVNKITDSQKDQTSTNQTDFSTTGQIEISFGKRKLAFLIVLQVGIILGVGAVSTLLSIFIGFSQQDTVVKYSFHKNVSYNYILNKNTTYIKDGHQAVASTSYFSRIICQEANGQYFDLLFIVYNVTIGNNNSYYNYSVFPEAEQIDLGKSSHGEDESNAILKAFVESFLNFRFRHSIKTGKIQFISYPKNISSEFRVLIPRAIQLLLPAANKTFYETKEGILQNRIGLGSIRQRYTKQFINQTLLLKKSFQKQPSNQSKLNNSFSYSEQAIFQGSRLKKNSAYSQTRLFSSQNLQEILTVKQALRLAYVNQNVLDKDNVSLYKTLFELNQLKVSQSPSSLVQQIIDQAERKNQINEKSMPTISRPQSLSKQGLSFYQFRKQDVLFKTSFYGIPVQGAINYFLQFNFKNQSNLIKPVIQAGAFSTFKVTGLFSFRLAQQIIYKETMPISFRFTLNKIISFIVKYSANFQKIFQIAKSSVQAISVYQTKQLDLSSLKVQARFVQISYAINRKMSSLDMYKKPKQMSRLISSFYDNSLQEINKCIKTQMKLVDEIYIQSIKILEQIRNKDKSQQVELRSKSLQISKALSFPQLKKQSFTTFLNQMRSAADQILANQLIQEEFKKTEEKLVPVYVFYSKLKEESNQIIAAHNQLQDSYKSSIGELTKSIATYVIEYRINDNVKAILQRAQARKSKLDQILLKSKLQSQTILAEMQAFLKSLIPDNNVFANLAVQFIKFKQEIQMKIQKTNEYLISGIQKLRQEINTIFIYSKAAQIYQTFSSPADLGFSFNLVLESYSVDLSKDLDYSLEYKNIQKFYESLINLRVQLNRIKIEKEATQRKLFQIICYYNCADNCETGLLDCSTLQTDSILESYNKLVFAINQVKSIGSLTQSFILYLQAQLNTINLFRTSRNNYNPSMHSQYKLTSISLSNLISQQANPVILKIGYLLDGFNLMKSQVQSSSLSKQKLQSLVELLQSKLTTNLQSLMQVESESFKIISQSILKLSQTTLRDSVLQQSFNKIATLSNQLINGIDQVSLMTLSSDKVLIQQAITSILNCLKLLLTFQATYSQKLMIFSSLEKLVTNYIKQIQGQEIKATNFQSGSQLKNSLKIFLQKAYLTASQLQKAYHTQLNSTIQIFSLNLQPEFNQDKRKQLQAFYLKSFCSKNLANSVSRRFFNFNLTILQLLSIVNTLDFQAKILYKSGQNIKNLMIPAFNQELQNIQKEMNVLSDDYKAISQLQQNFELTKLNEMIESIRENSLKMTIQGIQQQIKFDFTVNHLKTIQRPQFYSLKNQILSLLTTYHVSFASSSQITRNVILDKYNQLLPVLHKTMPDRLQLIIQSLKQLKGLEGGLTSQITDKASFMRETIDQLESEFSQKVLNLPLEQRQFVGNVKMLIKDEINLKMGWLIDNITQFKAQSSKQLYQIFDTLILLCINSKSILAASAPYQQPILKLVQDLSQKITVSDFQFIYQLSKGLKLTSNLLIQITDRLNLVSLLTTLTQLNFFILFNMKTYQLQQIGHQLSKNIGQLQNQLSQLNLQIQDISGKVTNQFESDISFKEQVKALFQITKRVNTGVRNLNLKVRDLKSQISENFKQNLFQRMNYLKQGESYAINKIAQLNQKQQQNSLQLYSQKFERPFNQSKQDFSLLITTPAGCFHVKFQLTFAAVVGVSLSVKQSRTLAGQFFVQGYVDLKLSLNFNLPKIQFEVVLKGRFFDAKIVIGLTVQNFIPLSYIPPLKDDQDFKRDSKVQIYLKAKVAISRCWLNSMTMMRYQQTKQYNKSEIKTCVGAKCLKLLVIQPRGETKQIRLEQRLFYQEPSRQILINDQKLFEQNIW